MLDKLEEIASKILYDLGSCANDEQCLEVIKSGLKTYSSTKTKPLPDPAKEDAFKEFWAKYNKRVARAKAYKIFMKLKQEEIDKIIATIDTFVAVHSDLQYRPHPATYLNQRRWEDELDDRPQSKITKAKENTWTWQ